MCALCLYLKPFPRSSYPEQDFVFRLAPRSQRFWLTDMSLTALGKSWKNIESTQHAFEDWLVEMLCE